MTSNLHTATPAPGSPAHPGGLPTRRALLGALTWPALLAAGLGGCGGDDDESFERVWGAAAAGLVDGNAATARFSNPVHVAVAASGTVYVADFDNGKVRRIAVDGQVSTLNSPANFTRPFGLALSNDGQTLYVQTDRNDLGESGGAAGTVWRFALGGAADPVVLARNVGRVRGLLMLPDGRLAMSDLARHVLSLLDPATGVVTPLAGALDTPGYADGTGSAARFDRPYGLARLADGALLVADQNNHRLRRVTLAGEVSTYAGTGVAGATNGPLAAATFNGPQGVAISGSTVFVADTLNRVVRRIANGTVSTEAGTVGVAGFADGEGTAAQFYGLEGLALDAEGQVLWIADGNGGEGTEFNRVRRLKV